MNIALKEGTGPSSFSCLARPESIGASALISPEVDSVAGLGAICGAGLVDGPETGDGPDSGKISGRACGAPQKVATMLAQVEEWVPDHM